ncbi:MOSC domain-containing protein [Cellulomonas sp. P24]|uniref:MOSC domain-containing protein n=1 Tax=Cellulomonas sp. P24 TaxID=2885206 RepID=UPI00216B5AFB|nr:MOSC domain-containing protein [Cellulomonas sp. P24]MCR6493235.1 MOSC domain-containing protein [Cellulomonas sp. P24]
MRLLSVNTGPLRPGPPDGRPTGIVKQPVVGAVLVAPPGPRGTVALAGDAVGDARHHGGVDQAVYAYAREDLDRWERELGRDLAAGTFGENFTTVGVDVTGALIGERWRIGPDVVLEVSSPRIPCATFEGRMGVPGWIARFMAAGRPGAYLRVVVAGEVRAGDPVEVVHRPDHDVTIGVTFRAMTLEPELLPSLLRADALPEPIVERARRRTGTGSTSAAGTATVEPSDVGGLDA